MLKTATETCELLHISRTTLWELQRSGQLKSLRIGTRGIRFALVEIERFIAEATQQESDRH